MDRNSSTQMGRAAQGGSEGAREWLGMLQNLAEQIHKQQQTFQQQAQQQQQAFQQMVQESMSTYAQLFNILLLRGWVYRVEKGSAKFLLLCGGSTCRITLEQQAP